MKSQTRSSGYGSKWQSVVLAFAATLLALPVQAALTIPTVPPRSGAGVPPNILFILDDSGSMEFTYMPDTPRRTDSIDISRLTFNRGALSYDPRKTYQPWMKADGTRMSSGQSVTQAHRDVNTATNTGSIVGRTDAIFFLPKTLSADPQSAADYYRYRIGSGPTLYRSELSNIASALDQSGLSVANGNWSGPHWFEVPANSVLLEIRTRGSNGNVDLIARHQDDDGWLCSSGNGGSNESCVIQNPKAGWWQAYLYGGQSANSVRLTAVAAREKNVTAVSSGLAGGRNISQELANIATWYSYHRSRMKVAKAGASDAFSQLDIPVRVGYRTIHRKNPMDIPVGTNNGLFSGINRTTWYERLHTAGADGGTPLRRALDDAGQYFSDESDSGPYGGDTDEDGNQFACRQNFSILTTDGFWNDNSSSVVNPVFAGPGNQDGTNGPTVTGPEGKSYTYEAEAPYTDNQSNTLADVAMRYWKNDLRPTMSNIVPVTAANPAFWQHMVTFGISIGLSGELDPDGPLPGTSGGPTAWPDVRFDIATGSAAVLARIDDLLHAAVNSRGEFISASDANEFAEGLESALSAITERTASASNVAANSTSLGTDTKLFQASYVGGQWTGELRAFAVSEDGIAAGSPLWEASEQLPAYGSRRVFTRNGLGGTGGGATFPTSTQQAALATSLGTGAEVANYLKGDSSKEKKSAGGVFRDRLHALGDIIHSSPAYIEASNTVFVGGNDGMLHAFNADTGAERFAYVPASLDMTQLRTLSNPDYAHRYFVDGPLAISTKQQTPNRNILVGTLGRGGRGVFGLNVTSPDSFGTTSVLWDRGSADIPALGNVIGDPIIAKLNDGSTGVIIGNGINSASDQAVLLVLNIETGSVIASIPTDGTTANGLSAPRGWDSDADGDVDYVYAGDLQGNVWKFDLTDSNTNSWDVAIKQGSNARPLFVAKDASGNRQPITGGVSIGIDPTTYKQWVFVGTGRFLTSDDPEDDSVQSMYGLIDEGAQISGRAQLQERTTVATGSIGGTPVRGFESSDATLNASKKGWFIDFAPPAPGTAEGERMVGRPALISQVLLFSSIIPSSDPCTPGGRGYINALNAFTGASVGEHFFDVDGDGQYSDDTLPDGDETVPVGSVDLGVGMNTDPLLIEKLIGVGGSGGNTGSVGVNNPAASGRVSWRELITD